MPPSDNILHGNSVRLTALEREDLAAVARWFQNAEFMRLLDARAAQPKSEAQLLAWMEEQQKSPDAFLLAIRGNGDGELLGYVELDGILWPHQTGWLTIAIGDPAHWNQGYGYEAAQLALRFAFHELNLRRMQLTVFAYNERAIGLYEKLGFRREGVFREFLQRDGQRHDMILYGLLRREWEAGRGFDTGETT